MIDYEATPGIRTRYKGINFRSRLEAKYAVLFDILEWKWHCEPIDLKGWIPDFAIVGRKKPIYVEVKPIWKINEPAAEPIKRKIEKALFFDMPDTDDIDFEFEPAFEALICGAGLPDHGLAIGGLWDWDWDTAPVIDLSDRKREGYGFCHSSMSFVDRITGSYNGGDYCTVALDEMWAEAGNAVQWHPHA
jgi:hypothetical protein